MNLDLFEPLSKTITLPTYLFSIKVGGNRVERYFCKMLVANYTIIDADIPGYYQLNSDLKAPFNKILLKKWGGKRTPYPIDTLVLKFKFETKINNLSENTLLAWENIHNSFISLDSISITH